MDINKFWSDVINQNRTMLYSYFDNDAVIRWHCTNEIFTVDEYIKANCDYPGKWCGKIERIENLNNQIIIVGSVQSYDGTIKFHVTSFIKLCDNKICEMDEYWAEDGEAPAWRKKLSIGKAIR